MTEIDPTQRTVVHLLRHGKVHNPDAILYGRLPGYRLSASGVAMAELAAASLHGEDVRYLAASSLERAQQTAEAVARRADLPIVTDDRLLEADNSFAGSRVAGRDSTLRTPANWTKLRDPFTPSWGEPYLAIAHRMLGAVYTAVDRAAGASAVLVSHQLPIWTVRRYLTGHRLWHNPMKRQCGLASLTSLEFVGGVFTAVHYSEPAATIVAEDDPAAGDAVEAGA